MDAKPDRLPPLLIGLIIDVSSSMQRNWTNRSAKQMPRIEALRDSLNVTLLRLSTNKISTTRQISLFCLGMGFRRPMYWTDMEMSYGEEGKGTASHERTDVAVVCDLIALCELLPKSEDLAIIQKLVDRKWAKYSSEALNSINFAPELENELRHYISNAIEASAQNRFRRRLLIIIQKLFQHVIRRFPLPRLLQLSEHMRLLLIIEQSA